MLTPRAGVSVGGIINKLEEHDGLKVIYCIRIPCYLTPEELAQAELYRMEMEEK
ncbi:MAG: hypothetical protein GWN58_16440 [Anaerolineae bacterium]|nr:hypothetical protein [Anaerolineae bacterium]